MPSFRIIKFSTKCLQTFKTARFRLEIARYGITYIGGFGVIGASACCCALKLSALLLISACDTDTEVGC